MEYIEPVYIENLYIQRQYIIFVSKCQDFFQFFLIA